MYLKNTKPVIYIEFKDPKGLWNVIPIQEFVFHAKLIKLGIIMKEI